MSFLSPQGQRRLQKFKSLKRGYYSFIIMITLIILSLAAELLVNNRPLIVQYNDHTYFPTYGDILPGTTFGYDYQWETNYKELEKDFSQGNNKNWLIMPIIPFNPFENNFIEGEYPPYAPSLSSNHYLGTDMAGRDIFARLIYGFRIAILFSLLLLVVTYVIGVSLGAFMGYLGGTFDLVFQRVIEILSNVPILYIIMIVASIITPNFWTLALLLAAFSWMGLTWYMRTETYRENTREYVLAARAIGASNTRIMFKHILPNSISILVTFFPFSVVSGITALTSLDYLGFGLPTPTPSWGELLQQGTSNLEYQWIAASAVAALSIVLTLVTFIGEAIREAFDPKKYSYYE
jgi:microcin C transport system permease protein